MAHLAAYARCMAAWLQETARAPTAMYIAAAALPAFCAGVLATVAPYVTVEGDTQALAPTVRGRWRCTSIWMAPEPDAVTARVEYHYGEDTVLPFLGGAGGSRSRGRIRWPSCRWAA